jgi:thioredoxin reductase (NADPH)
LDDDPNVLRAVERDLRSEYGAEYRVVRADSGSAALELLDELKRRGEAAALFLVDQRMPSMTGVEFLEQAIQSYPDTRRVLLTAYADTDAAIDAINQVQIDHYLLKPWDPPEEKLYPVISDLLDDWRAAYRPPFDGIRVVGHQWSPDSHRVKDFLAGNHVPYLWLDLATSGDGRRLMEGVGDATELPLLFWGDGSCLQNPTNREVASRVGLQTVADQPLYDLLVVGAGPAGLAAAVYGASEGLKTLVVEEQAPGGQAGTSSRIENYLGFPSGVSGAELARRAVIQAKRFGAEILTAQTVVGLDADGTTSVVSLGDGTKLTARALLIATGVSYRTLQTKGVEALTGAGVYYGAALSEGESVRDQDVFIVGGANSAGQAAMYFTRFAKSVTLLVRGSSLSNGMSQYLIDQIEGMDTIRVRTRTQVQEVVGEDRLEGLVLSTGGGATIERVPAAALFILIGAVPRTDWLGDAVARDDHGFILSGSDAMTQRAETSQDTPKRRATVAAVRPSERMVLRSSRESTGLHVPSLLETSLPGVFVAGDVRASSVKRVASAVGEGAMAVMYVHKYLSRT